MDTTNTNAAKKRGRQGQFFDLSPWLVLLVAAILGLAVLALSVRESNREKRKMTDSLLEKANALVWALEAGTRTWLGYEGDRNVLQALIEETAKQPGIVYLAVADETGKVLAHSDRDKIGETVDLEGIGPISGLDKPKWRTVENGDDPVFLVHRRFAPIAGGGDEEPEHQGHHGSTRGRGRMMGRRMGMQFRKVAEGENVVVLGLDQKPFREAMRADLYNSVLTAGIVAGLGLAGLVSVFWAQRYRRSHKLLMNARALSSEVVTNLPLGLVACDNEGRVEIANGTAGRMLGEKLEGRSLFGMGGLDWRGMAGELSGGGKVLERETELRLADGGIVPIRLSASQIRNGVGEVSGYIFILADIGEVRRLRSEVQRNERLTELGNLAAGVAHEIRNPLSTIKGLATYMAGKMPDGERERNAGRTIIMEVNRLNNVVSELLEYSRPGVENVEPADVGEVAARAIRLAEADIRGKGIVVDFDRGEGLPRVPLNAERFTQALLNLILNAVQAMDAGGRLGVRLQADEKNGVFGVTVEDNGAGMGEDVRRMVFSPYFTTKVGGTGLGLAIVQQIVDGHGGSVRVRSAVGEGSAFTILLPMEPGAAAKDGK